VELTARALEQRLIRRLLDQRVLERVRGHGWLAARKKDFRLDQACQAVAEGALVESRCRRQQRVPEVPSQDRRPLRHLLRCRQPVEPSHQRVGERRRDRFHTPRRPRLDDRLRQLLDVERHAVGADDQCIQRGDGQRFARECQDHVPRLALGETGEVERRQVLGRRPRRRELGPRREDDQDARRRALCDEVPQQLQRRRVVPVQILDHDHEWLHRADGEDPPHEQVDRLPPLQLGAQLQPRGWRQAEKVREQGHVLR
jgi:hypothetical protein